MKNLDCYLSNLMIGNIKLHNLHWNVTGLTFKAVREYLETLYEDSFEKYDEVAELQKQFGLPVLASAKDYLENTSLKELGNAEYSPREAIELAKEYIETMRALALTIREEAQKEDCFVLIWVPRRYAEVIDGTKKQSEYSHCIRSVFCLRERRVISRVMSWMIIYLAVPSPAQSSNLPGQCCLERQPTGRRSVLFGLASDGVYMCPGCYHPGGGLLAGGSFLLHFPGSFLHRTLSGILPFEARTFLTCSLSSLQPRSPARLSAYIIAQSPMFVYRLCTVSAAADKFSQQGGRRNFLGRKSQKVAQEFQESLCLQERGMLLRNVKEQSLCIGLQGCCLIG